MRSTWVVVFLASLTLSGCAWEHHNRVRNLCGLDTSEWHLLNDPPKDVPADVVPSRRASDLVFYFSNHKGQLNVCVAPRAAVNSDGCGSEGAVYELRNGKWVRLVPWLDVCGS